MGRKRNGTERRDASRALSRRGATRRERSRFAAEYRQHRRDQATWGCRRRSAFRNRRNRRRRRRVPPRPRRRRRAARPARRPGEPRGFGARARLARSASRARLRPVCWLQTSHTASPRERNQRSAHRACAARRPPLHAHFSVTGWPGEADKSSWHILHTGSASSASNPGRARSRTASASSTSTSSASARSTSASSTSVPGMARAPAPASPGPVETGSLSSTGASSRPTAGALDVAPYPPSPRSMRGARSSAGRPRRRKLRARRDDWRPRDGVRERGSTRARRLGFSWCP